MSKRADILLSLVLDIKNNKRHDKAGGSSRQSLAVHKWLQKASVGGVQLKTLPWQKLLASNKKVSILLRCSCTSFPESDAGTQQVCVCYNVPVCS